MKYLLLILLSINLLAMDPVVKVPQLPGDIQLEAYEESEELFVSKVMEYYEIAVMYKSQIENLGLKPDQRIVPPSLEELNDMELDVIIKYYNLARSLEGQIQSINYIQIRSELKDLQDTVNFLKAKHLDELWDLKNSYLETELDIINERDSICRERIMQIEEKLDNGCQDCESYISVGVTENFFFHSESFVESQPNVGIKIGLNTAKLFGLGRNISLWYEYQAPRLTTNAGTEENPNDFRWNSHISSLGFSTDFYPVFSTEKISNGLKLGLGYFWSEGSIYNEEFGSYYWEGGRADLEYYIGSNSSRFPFELFISGSLYQSFNGNMKFFFGENVLPEGDVLDIGASIFSVNVGIRYNFWSSRF